MSREQAERLIIERNGDLCARYYQRPDGTVLTADCRQERPPTRVAAVAGIAALLAGGGAVVGHELADDAPTAEAVPAFTGDADEVPIDVGGSETQRDQQAETIVKDKFEFEQPVLIMGKTSIVDHDVTLERLKVQKQKLDALRVEIEPTK